MDKISNEKKGYIQLILFSLLNGIVGVFLRLIQGMNAYSILFSRSVIATITIFLIVAYQGKLSELKLRHFKNTFLVAIFQGVSILFFFMAVMRTSISNTAFLVYSAPIFSVALSRVFLKEKITKNTLIGVVIAVTGIMFILNPATLTLKSQQVFGNLLALASGFLYAAMAVAAKPLRRTQSGYYVVFWQYLIIALLFLPFIGSNFIHEFTLNFLKLLIIGAVSTAIAFSLFMSGVKHVKGQKIFIVTSLEPLVSTLAALLVKGNTKYMDNRWGHSDNLWYLQNHYQQDLIHNKYHATVHGSYGR